MDNLQLYPLAPDFKNCTKPVVSTGEKSSKAILLKRIEGKMEIISATDYCKQ